MRDVLLLQMLQLLCCASPAAASAGGSCCVVLLLLLLVLTQAFPGVGQPEIYSYALPPRAPSGSRAPIVVPGATSGVA